MFVRDVLFALWLFWPAGVATLLPVLAAYVPGLRRFDAPMDFGKSWRGHRLLGDHKTWRGFLAGWLGGSFWAVVQSNWYYHSSFVQSFYPASFNQSKFILLGVLISLGAVLGDAVGSFFKRQLDIPSGKSWIPVDQVDFIVGGIALSLVVMRFPLLGYGFILLTWTTVHLIFGVLGYLTKTKPDII